MNGDGSLYLKCIYEISTTSKVVPITEINFYRIKKYKENSKILIKPEEDSIEPIPIADYPNNANYKIQKGNAGKLQRAIVIYRGDYDVAHLINAEKKNDSCLVSMIYNIVFML